MSGIGGTPTRFYSSSRRHYSPLLTPSTMDSSQNHRPRSSCSTPVYAQTYGPGDVLPVGDRSYGNLDISDDDFDHVHDMGNDSQFKRLVDILDKQGTSIKQILHNQDEIMVEQDVMKQELEALKCGDSNPKKAQKRISRVLTDRINTLHGSLVKKLKPNESSSTTHNQEVMAKLIDELKSDPDAGFPLTTIKLAVKRKYESERRSFNDASKGEDFHSCRVKKAKYDRRKKRAFDRRKSVLTESEKKYYAQLSKEYMTDESDSPDSECITVHKVPWRSQKVNEWFAELDRRYRNKLDKNNSATPSKERKLASPAKSKPPPAAPKWAIDQSWENDSLGSGSTTEQGDQDTENEHSFQFEE